ncbi:hypothetical protein AKJ13_26715 [Methylobacterium sp. ARG-1]|nr:hypothetical protein AKJ13_26715 [Methylobacterium sp. ARG-1]
MVRDRGEPRAVSACWCLMRTALITLIVLVRFGPDLVYAANASLPQPDLAHRTITPKWIGSPPAVVVIYPPAP